MSTLTDLQSAVADGAATPELWQATLAEYEALAARPAPGAWQALQDERDAARAQLADLAKLREREARDEENVRLALTAEIDQHRAAHAEAITRLKSAYAIQHAVPEELLAGATVAELETSVTSAKAIVEKIAAGIRAATAAQVPNGSPGRTGPNLEAMSPIEKIRFGLAQSNGA